VFRFLYGTAAAVGDDVNHFVADHNPMLAFAARATSSFPVAFPPVCLDDVLTELTPAGTSGTGADRFRGFFSRYHAERFDKVFFADGGDLDNKPFGPLLDVLPLRRAALPVARKILYVEPDPGTPERPSTDPIRPTIVQNALAAGLLPRVETIGAEVQAVRDFGQLVQSREAQYGVVKKALQHALGRLGGEPALAGRPAPAPPR
jgi:hypothetical protein